MWHRSIAQILNAIKLGWLLRCLVDGSGAYVPTCEERDCRSGPSGDPNVVVVGGRALGDSCAPVLAGGTGYWPSGDPIGREELVPLP